MKKTALLLLALTLIGSSAFAAVGKDTKGPFGYNLYDDITRKPDAPKQEQASKETPQNSSGFYGDNIEAAWEQDYMYYPNASLSSAVNKYKKGNFSGCLQEMISLTKIDSANPLVYYYMGMAYTQVGNKDQAVKAYEKVIKLNPDRTLVQYATKGRDCLVGGPTCLPETSEGTDAELDNFIKSPYGNGFSEDLNEQVKQQQLKDIQKTINKKQKLEDEDIEKIQKFDEKSEAIQNEKLADASNSDVLAAIETLKKAGVNISINPYQSAMPTEYNELSMFLGSNNNNNNSMMNMLPYLMSQHENGKNIDPQIIQAMMMNSMLPDFTFNDKDKNY